MDVVRDTNLRQLMTDVGPLLEAAEVREYREDTWILALDDDLAIAAELDAQRGVLVLSTDLGHPLAGTEALAFKLLLQVSSLWHQTSGLRMGLDTADGSVLQLCDLSVTGLSAGLLAERLLTFADFSRKARRGLASMEPEVQTTRPFEFLRV